MGISCTITITSIYLKSTPPLKPKMGVLGLEISPWWIRVPSRRVAGWRLRRGLSRGSAGADEEDLVDSMRVFGMVHFAEVSTPFEPCSLILC